MEVDEDERKGPESQGQEERAKDGGSENACSSSTDSWGDLPNDFGKSVSHTVFASGRLRGKWICPSWSFSSTRHAWAAASTLSLL